MENKLGRFVEVIGILGKYDIDILVLLIVDIIDFGILRFIVNKFDLVL